MQMHNYTAPAIPSHSGIDLIWYNGAV